jgi:hypothetical protein
VPALLMTLTMSAPAWAGAGLPTLARIDVGSYQAQLLGDSPRLHTGTNTMTVVVPGLTADSQVSLTFVGPKEQVVQVPLRPLVVLEGPDGGHGSSGHDESAEAHRHNDEENHAAGDHHGQAGGHEIQDHHSEAASSNSHGEGVYHDDSVYQLRGKAVLPESGTWMAVLNMNGASGAFKVDVVQDGPNRIYLGVIASVMGAALIYGIVGRRRQQSKGA